MRKFKIKSENAGLDPRSKVSVKGRECPSCHGDGRAFPAIADRYPRLGMKCQTCNGTGKR